MSTSLEGQGARRKDNYYLESEENEVCFLEADNEYQRLKEDFARSARNRRTRHHFRSDSSKSPSPRRRQPPRRSTNPPKFKIATFCATDVELWFIRSKHSSIFIKSMTMMSGTVWHVQHFQARSPLTWEMSYSNLSGRTSMKAWKVY